MATNLKIFAIVIVTVLIYTAIANSIPQVQSEVPQELTFTGAVTPEQLVAAGEQLFNGAGGCTACHGLGTRAPNLLADEGGTGTIGVRCGAREPGKSCKQYLHESLVQPTAHVVAGYQPIMPDMSKLLSPAQIWSLVAFLESQGGKVDVTAADMPAEGERAAQAGAGASAAGAAATDAAAAAGSEASEPREIIAQNQCLTCHRIGDEGGAIGPDLSKVGARLRTDEIRRSILEPNADTAQGFEAVAGTMPQTFGRQLTAAQLEALVDYLAGLK